jgi:predicted DNA-binding protein (UPF0251 family)
MLTHTEVSPTCIYWSNRFQCRKFEFDELYNVAYLTAIKQTTVLTLQKSVRGALLRFMAKQNRFTNSCQTFQSDNLNSGEENNLALCTRNKDLQSMIDSEELSQIMVEANLNQSSEFIVLLRLRFVENLNQKQIAEKYHVSQQIISSRLTAILESLITVNKRRMLCLK